MQKKIISMTVATLIFLYTFPVLAIDFSQWSGLDQTAGNQGAGYSLTRESVPTVIGVSIHYALSFVGVLLLVIILIGYLKISNAGGNEDEVQKGKAWIRNGALGLLLVMAAYVITMMVFAWLKAGVFG